MTNLETKKRGGGEHDLGGIQGLDVFGRRHTSKDPKQVTTASE